MPKWHHRLDSKSTSIAPAEKNSNLYAIVIDTYILSERL